MSLGTCKVCFRYTDLVDAITCKRCKKKMTASYPERLFLTFRKGYLVPRNSMTGGILSKSEWYRVKHKIDRFYESITSDEIDILNEEDAERLLNYPTPGYIYLMKSSNGYHKIGRATHPIHRRDNLMREYPLQIELIFSIKVRDCVRVERKLLNAFAEKQLQGEWFKFDDRDIERFYRLVEKISKSKSAPVATIGES